MIMDRVKYKLKSDNLKESLGMVLVFFARFEYRGKAYQLVVKTVKWKRSR